MQGGACPHHRPFPPLGPFFVTVHIYQIAQDSRVRVLGPYLHPVPFPLLDLSNITVPYLCHISSS